MTDRFWEDPDEEKPTPTEKLDKTEGVRIIGAEEAAEAIERGDVAQRRPEGQPRYGDRPAAPPDDVKAAVRFPMPNDESDAWARPKPVVPSMPHWTDPPTGEVPRILPPSDDQPAPTADDDLEAWSSFAGSPRWRDQADDWAAADFDAEALGGTESPIGALDERTRDDDDLFASMETPAPAAAAATAMAISTTEPPKRTAEAPKARSRPAGNIIAAASGGRDMPTAIATGVALVVAAMVTFLIGPGAAMVLVTAILLLAAVELFSSLRDAGYQPATLLGIVASGGVGLAAYWQGESAIPLVLSLSVIFTLLWYLLGISRVHPLMNAGVTVLGIGLVGLLGSYAALILSAQDGIGILVGVLVAVVANDIGAFVFGQQFGHSPIAPQVSPNKTFEGLIGGTVMSVAASLLVLGMIGVEPWDTGSALALAIVVSIVAPLGDVCQSMIKRDLGIKDMGSLLPGHGGFYDRFDGLLFALPAAFYLARVLDLVPGI
jgi:phosphatidate cytidylyltransferase